ncbi:MAG: hypothetical protein GY847_06890 [Proteobacteria bacterium]|nr:hypothetical protein [Pseudomonadota bacterium]
MRMRPRFDRAKSAGLPVFLAALLIAANVALCCSPNRRAVHSESGMASSDIMLFDGSLCRSPDVIFSVISADSQALESVDAYLVKSTGIKHLGQTDPLGAICVPYEEINATSSRAILFCAEWFFCGGFIIDHENFSRFRDRLLVLSPFAVK